MLGFRVIPSSALLADVSTTLGGGVSVSVLAVVVTVVVVASGRVDAAKVDAVCNGPSSTLTTVSADDLSLHL